MANRCPDCNKFVSLDLDQEPDIEVTNLEDLGNGKAMLSLNMTLKKVCAECGAEISQKETSIDVEVDLDGFEEV